MFDSELQSDELQSHELQRDELQSDELRSVARYLGMAVAGDAISLETAARALAECTGPDAPERVTAALIASSAAR